MPATDPATGTIPPGPAEDVELGASGFVWGVWGLMTLVALVFVAHYATTIPVWDDENVIPVLLGARPLTWGWLWEQCNEHRLALPKLLLVFADRWAGHDIRAGMFLSVAALSALAAGLLNLLGRLRGGSHAADACLPILLLHPGHVSNLLWSIQFAFVLPTALATVGLIVIAGRSRRPGVIRAGGMGLILFCLPLCGGNGLVFVPALACWLIGAAVLEARSSLAGSWRRASVLALTTVPGLSLMSYYFQGFQPGVRPVAAGGTTDILRTALQFLAGGVGVPAGWVWPASGMVTGSLLTWSIMFLTRAWIEQPLERTRIFGLFCFLGGVLSMAVAVGWGRGWAGGMAGFQDRYVTLATPFWCWLVVTIRLYAPVASGRGLMSSLFAVTCLLAWPNAEFGIKGGQKGSEQAGRLTHDIQTGMPPYQIIHKYGQYLHPSSDRLSQLLGIMRAGQLGPFTELQLDPPLREIALPIKPASSSLVRWQGTTAQITGINPQILFTLPAPTPVAGVRIRYSHTNPAGSPARFVMTWSNGADEGADDARRHADWNLPTGTDRETTIWVDARIDRFQIQPDNQPGIFRFDALTLLIAQPARNP